MTPGAAAGGRAVAGMTPGAAAGPRGAAGTTPGAAAGDAGRGAPAGAAGRTPGALGNPGVAGALVMGTLAGRCTTGAAGCDGVMVGTPGRAPGGAGGFPERLSEPFDMPSSP
jgi:hypothetical protein